MSNHLHESLSLIKTKRYLMVILTKLVIFICNGANEVVHVDMQWIYGTGVCHPWTILSEI